MLFFSWIISLAFYPFLHHSVECELTFFEKSKISMLNLKLCGVPYSHKEFNTELMKISCFPKDFTDSIHSIDLGELAYIPYQWETFYNKINLISALLNNPKSILCRALLDNTNSYINYLYNKVTLSNQLENLPGYQNSGLLIYKEFFMKTALLEEIQCEFFCNSALRMISFPSYLHPIASSDIFGIISFAINIECDPFSISRKIWSRIDEFVRFISDFHLIVNSPDQQFLSALFHILSTPNLVENRLQQKLLFAPMSPLSIWILMNFQKVTSLSDKEEFIDSYLNILFNSEIYTFIFNTLIPYNSVDKLVSLKLWPFGDKGLNDLKIKYFFLANYQLRLYCTRGFEYILIAANFSRYLVDSYELEAIIVDFFNLDYTNHIEIQRNLSQLIYLFCFPEWITNRINQDNITEKEIFAKPSISRKKPENSSQTFTTFKNGHTLNFLDKYFQLFITDLTEPNRDVRKKRLIDNLNFSASNKKQIFTLFETFNNEELNFLEIYYFDSCKEVIKALKA